MPEVVWPVEHGESRETSPRTVDLSVGTWRTEEVVRLFLYTGTFCTCRVIPSFFCLSKPMPSVLPHPNSNEIFRGRSFTLRYSETPIGFA